MKYMLLGYTNAQTWDEQTVTAEGDPTDLRLLRAVRAGAALLGRMGRFEGRGGPIAHDHGSAGRRGTRRDRQAVRGAEGDAGQLLDHRCGLAQPRGRDRGESSRSPVRRSRSGRSWTGPVLTADSSADRHAHRGPAATGGAAGPSVRSCVATATSTWRRTPSRKPCCGRQASGSRRVFPTARGPGSSGSPPEC